MSNFRYRAREMKMQPGTYAVYDGNEYFVDSVTNDLNKAKVQALYMSAHFYRSKMDQVHNELHRLGAINSADEYGYLA